MSRKNNYKRNGGLNWTAIIVSAICALVATAVIVVGAGSDWYKISDPAKWFGRGQSTVTPADPNTPKDPVADSGTDGMMITTQSTNTLRLSARAVTNFDKLPNTDNKYYLTATVLPVYADSKDLEWSLDFKNASTRFPSGSVGEYIRINVSADTHKAEVTCLKAFGEPIVITARSKENPDITATCECNYLQRHIVDIDIPKMGIGEIPCTIVQSSSEYTVESQLEIGKIYMYLTQGFVNYVKDQVEDDNLAYVSEAAGGRPGIYNSETNTIKFADSPRSFFFIDTGDGFEGDGKDEQALYQKLVKSFRDAVNTYSGEQSKVVIEYKVYYGDTLFESKTVTKSYNFDYESVKIAVGSVDFDDDGILM